MKIKYNKMKYDTVKIDERTKDFELGINEFLNSCPAAMVYHTPEYLRIVSEETNTELYYIIVKDKKERLKGVMPFQIKKSGLGNIGNSSCYYGSYGGPIVTPYLSHSDQITSKRDLIDGFFEAMEYHECILSTIISSPLDFCFHPIVSSFIWDYWNYRITQMVPITPQYQQQMTKSCKRAIKRSLESNLSWGYTDGKKHTFLKRWYEIYCNNMKDKGIKQLEFFENLLDSTLDAGILTVYNNTIAIDNLVGGIFLLCYKNTIEYYNPAIRDDSRSSNAINFLIDHRILSRESNQDLFQWLNFGGGGKDKDGLHRFKRSFGALDFQYSLLTTIHGKKGIQHILEMTKEEIIEEYPDIFVVPFEGLKH